MKRTTPSEMLIRQRVMAVTRMLPGAQSGHVESLHRARVATRRLREALPLVDRRSMVAAELMGSVYWRLLRKLERQRFNVFGPKLTRLNKGQKTLLVLRTWWRFASGAMSPNYGTP